jgi:hypothetical protein
LGLLVFIKFKEFKSSDFLKNIRIIFNKLYSIFGIKISLIILIISLLNACILSWRRLKIYGFNYIIPFFVFFYLLLSKITVSFKGRIKNFIIILLIIALSLNGLRFAIYCSFLKPRIKLDKISKIIKNNNYKNSLIVSNDIYNSMAIFAWLNNSIKIITNKKILNKAKLFQADFLTNSFFVIDDFVITEDYPLEKYDRLWLITFDTKDLPELEWFFNKYAKNLLNTYIVDGCIIRLYTLR